MSDMETLSKLYLELANVVSTETKTSRELGLMKIVDEYEEALLRIRAGGRNPKSIALVALAKFSEQP